MLAASLDAMLRLFLNFDLGGSVSMGAFAAYWPMTGLLRVQCGLPANPDLRRRGMADGVGRRYLDMEAQGCLRTYPGRVLPVAEFLQTGADRGYASSRLNPLHIRRRTFLKRIVHLQSFTAGLCAGLFPIDAHHPSSALLLFLPSSITS